VDFKEENGKEFAEITMPGFSFTDFDRTGTSNFGHIKKVGDHPHPPDARVVSLTIKDDRMCIQILQIRGAF
jgi:hypothetical protein